MDKLLSIESKRVMGEPLGRRSASVRIENAGSNPASPATETAPLNGGIRQMVGASALSLQDSTSRESLPNSCERSLGDAAIRKDAGSNGDESCVEILHRNAQYKEPIVDFEPSPTIITEPVAAENNKQRER